METHRARKDFSKRGEAVRKFANKLACNPFLLIVLEYSGYKNMLKQVDKALCCKPEDRGFDSRWSYYIFKLT
jgi:hypothetical protein